MAERERTSATKCVTREQRDSRVRKVEDGMYHRKEAVRVGKSVEIPLVLVDAGAPEFGVVPAGDDSTFCTRTQSSLNVVEGFDHFIAYRRVQPVLFATSKRDDEDLLVSL